MRKSRGIGLDNGRLGADLRNDPGLGIGRFDPAGERDLGSQERARLQVEMALLGAVVPPLSARRCSRRSPSRTTSASSSARPEVTFSRVRRCWRAQGSAGSSTAERRVRVTPASSASVETGRSASTARPSGKRTVKPLSKPSVIVSLSAPSGFVDLMRPIP